MLSEKIETIYRNSRATYRATIRVHAELSAIGIRCSSKRPAEFEEVKLVEENAA